MALPEIRPPSGTPCFLAAGHAIAPQSVYADVQMRSGHLRRRRLFTTAPRIVSVSWLLEADQMAAVDTWFEDVLLAGERPFSAQVANQGPGLLWWTAQWVEPYQTEALHLGRWRVTGQLLLTGVGQVEDPYTPDMAVEFGAPLTSSAELTVITRLAVEFGAALLQVTGRLAVEFGSALVHENPYLLTEDGDILLTEDDDELFE